jgi:hypothetical protein
MAVIYICLYIYGYICVYIYLFIYVGDVRSSQETHVLDSRRVKGITVLSIYVRDARTSQETPTSLDDLLRRYFYFLYVDDFCTSQEAPV